MPPTQQGGERHLQFYANFRRARVIAKIYRLCGVSKIIVSSESIMIEKCKITKCIFSHHLRYMGAFSASQVEISKTTFATMAQHLYSKQRKHSEKLSIMYMYVSVCENRTSGEERGEGRQSALRSDACCN